MNQSQKSLRQRVAAGTFLLLSSFGFPAVLPFHLVAAEPVQVADPEEILDPPWLEERREAQLESAGQIGVFHDFRFSDRVEESGITFEHRIVDDAGRSWKPNHYDHGNGMAVADVDDDGRLDVYFVTQVGSNGLYLNLGGARFAASSASPDLALADRIGVAPSFADTDNDGAPDLFVTSVRGGNALLANDGKGLFRDISSGSGLDYSGHSSATVFFDYDRDGMLDAFVANVGKYTRGSDPVPVIGFARDGEDGDTAYYPGYADAFEGHLKPLRTEKSLLYENGGGNRFANVTAKRGLLDASWSGAATPIDANEDGWLDLYVLNMQGHDEYYENEGGERFTRKSRERFPRTPWGSMGVKLFDCDQDGDLDLYLTDMHSDMSEDIGVEREKLKADMKWTESVLRSGGMSIFGNAFFRNAGGGKFVEISDENGTENYWPWGLSVGDLNADGYEDLFITSSMNYGFRYGVNSLLLNDRGERFHDSEFILEVEPRRGGRTAKSWFELQCSRADSSHNLCAGREGRHVFWGALGSRTSAIFDLDDDGDLDIVTGEFNDGPMVLLSNLSEKLKNLRFLKVVLSGSRTNRDGLGSLVRVHAGGRMLTNMYDGQSGYLSQSSYPLYFGLGDAAEADSVEVHWLSGTRQVVEGPIAANQLIRIVEP